MWNVYAKWSSTPTVWQTSTIKSQLRPDVNLLKFSVLLVHQDSDNEIIKDLEPQARGVYCGTIGLLLPMDETNFHRGYSNHTTLLASSAGVGGRSHMIALGSGIISEVHQRLGHRKQPRFQLITRKISWVAKLLFGNSNDSKTAKG